MAVMTCTEVRELFSAHVDAALSADERARLDAHLAACAECTAEWRRFERTVGVVRAVAPARAPAGFVERVLAARPRPWYRRLARDVFVPWPVKLPLEAAAIVLVAGLAVVVLQRSPELQQAAYAPEPPAGTTAPSPPAGPPGQGAPDSVRAPARLEQKRALTDELATRKAESPTGARADSTTARDAARPAEAPRAKSAEAPEAGARTEANQERAGTATRRAAPAAPAPALQESRDRQTPSANESRLARLTVEDRGAAERTVGEIVGRAGGRVLSRSEERGVTVLSLAVPGDRWDEVTRGLQTLGTLRLEGEPRRSADLLRLTLRLER
jgi:hypothetical protein